jgi:hypothetical protein
MPEMIDETITNQTYRELFEKYASAKIDDYDVFIRSRVIEHFINTSPATSDVAAQAVAISIMEINAGLNENGTNAESGTEASTMLSETASTVSGNEKSLREYLPILTIVVFAAILLSRKKNVR